MCFNIFNTILIILSHQYFISSFSANTEFSDINNKKDTLTNSNNCSILVPRADDLRKPRPSATNNKPFSGYLHIKPGGYVNLSCSEDKFVSIADENTRQITVKCVGGTDLEYYGYCYNCHAITCNDIPEPEVMPDLEVWRKYSHSNIKRSFLDCFIPVSSKDNRLPIPFTLAFRPSIIVPDAYGNLFIRHNTSFKATCTTGKFQMLSIRHESDILLTCIEKNFLLFNQTVHKFSDFRCINIPKARFLLSNFKCQQNKYSLGAVGFQANTKFLILYNICFDIITKSNIYSWFRMSTPYRNELQWPSPARPTFIKTKQMFGAINVNTEYKKQEETLATILKSEEQVQKYINTEKELFLARGHLVAKTDFFYTFQQEATFFCENTAPQWQIFNKRVWRIVEKYFRQRLASEPMARHIIIAGTYGNYTLPDTESVQQTIYLTLNPRGIIVPKYIWKMDFNIVQNAGIVFIGLNDPYSRVNKSSYICETTQCPRMYRYTLQAYKLNHQGMVYCCTTESFEKTYGKIDPLRWQKNLL